jgi:hypothetical protein
LTRTAAAIIATAGVALPATVAFGSSHPTNVQKARAYSRCMRAHGVRNWPDPNSSGVFPKRTAQQLGVSSSQLQAAQTACQSLFPNPPGGQPTPAELQRMESDALKLARCMRSHRVSNWPDYTLRGGIPIFDLHGSTIAPESPQILTTQARCTSLLHLTYSPPTSGGAR